MTKQEKLYARARGALIRAARHILEKKTQDSTDNRWVAIFCLSEIEESVAMARNMIREAKEMDR